jgi:hypothetical protein
VRHEEVSGRGSLELWAHFPGGQLCSARTESSSGPARYLEGTSQWREFALLIDAPAAWGKPNRLVLNVGLPGPGTVWLGSLSLVGHPAGWRATLGRYGWWIAGAVAAIIALAFDAFVLAFARKGRARTGVTLGLIAMLLCGACLLVAGALAAACGRRGMPPAPAAVAGSLVAVMAGLGFLRARRLYGERELRKMNAMDAM